MKITTFAKLITEQEEKKVEVNIAQVAEILKIINKISHGLLYVMIRWIK